MQILLIIALLLGGTTIAAERAVPGNALYGMKININERVAGAFAISTEADADWHARAAERRLEEAEKLAAKGKLTAEAKSEIQTNFMMHADMVQEGIAKLKADGDTEAMADVSTEFAATLREHEAIIAGLTAKGAVELSTIQETLQAEAVTQEQTSREVQSGASVDIDVDVGTTGDDDDGMNATGSAGVKVDVGGSSERQEGGACTPPAPTSYGKSACCDTKNGQWYFAPAGCTGGSAI